MTVRSAVPGVLPGTDFRHAVRLMEAEIGAPHLGALPELTARGHHASLLGRAGAQLSELYTELTSYGWRLVARPGADHQRATQLLSADVDTLADVRGHRAEQGHDGGPVKLEILGPVSLAAQVHLPGGEKALIDHGARRDLAESLAVGVAAHIEHVKRSVAPPWLAVSVLEPDYGRVGRGEVPTVSGYRTIRSLPRDETRTLSGTLIQALRAAGVDEILLDFGEPVNTGQSEDFRGRTDVRVDGFALPVTSLKAADWERTAELVDDGAVVLASLLQPDDIGNSPDALAEVTQLATRLTRPWHELGMPPSSLSSVTVTPFGAAHRQRMAEVSDTVAARALARLRDTAEALTQQISS